MSGVGNKKLGPSASAQAFGARYAEPSTATAPERSSSPEEEKAPTPGGRRRKSRKVRKSRKGRKGSKARKTRK